LWVTFVSALVAIAFWLRCWALCFFFDAAVHITAALFIACTVKDLHLRSAGIKGDRRTGVGEILAATRLSNLAYVTSKFISNFAVLTFMMILLAAVAVPMQLLSRVEDGFSLWALGAPFLFVCLPVLALVAATAVLFESIKWLRGTIGNILYLIVAEFAFINNMLLDIPVLDFGGFGIFIPSMEAAALAAYPGAELGFEMGFIIESTTAGTMKLFRWEGIDWSLAMVPLRLLWVGCAVCLAGVATLSFDRFDPSRTSRAKPSKRKRGRRAKRFSPVVESVDGQHPTTRSWSEIDPVKFGFNFVRMLTAELRLTLKGYHWSWYGIAGALLVVQLAVPYEYARAYALPASMIWPLALWSGMGAREGRFNTRQLMFSSTFPVSRQFPAVWFAGGIVASLAGGGMLLRAILVGEAAHATALLIGVLFVPTYALALGTVTGSRKLFEVTYLLMWYIGPVNGLPFLDFVGTTDAAAKGSIPLLYLGASLVLAIIALLSRWRQVAGGQS
jgi:hypothetical protein